MDNDSNNPSAPARSGQATGYATAVDAALALTIDGFTMARSHPAAQALAKFTDMREGWIYSESAASVLGAEVIRLRSVIERIAWSSNNEPWGCAWYRAVASEAITWRSHNARDLSDGRTEDTK